MTVQPRGPTQDLTSSISIPSPGKPPSKADSNVAMIYTGIWNNHAQEELVGFKKKLNDWKAVNLTKITTNSNLSKYKPIDIILNVASFAKDCFQKIKNHFRCGDFKTDAELHAMAATLVDKKIIINLGNKIVEELAPSEYQAQPQPSAKSFLPDVITLIDQKKEEITPEKAKILKKAINEYVTAITEEGVPNSHKTAINELFNGGLEYLFSNLQRGEVDARSDKERLTTGFDNLFRRLGFDRRCEPAQLKAAIAGMQYDPVAQKGRLVEDLLAPLQPLPGEEDAENPMHAAGTFINDLNRQVTKFVIGGQTTVIERVDPDADADRMKQVFGVIKGINEQLPKNVLGNISQLINQRGLADSIIKLNEKLDTGFVTISTPADIGTDLTYTVTKLKEGYEIKTSIQKNINPADNMGISLGGLKIEQTVMISNEVAEGHWTSENKEALQAAVEKEGGCDVKVSLKYSRPAQPLPSED